LPSRQSEGVNRHAGRDALGFYHEKKDDARDVGLGPEHDWSSHAADAFGLMAISYVEPGKSARFNRKIEYPKAGIV
jgi:phage terminase large subunit